MTANELGIVVSTLLNVAWFTVWIHSTKERT